MLVTIQRYVFCLFFFGVALVACRVADDISIVPIDPVTAEQASLVSIQATNATSAEVIVKSIRLREGSWTLTARSANGQNVAFTANGPARPVGEAYFRQEPMFSLTTYSATGLTAGQTYQFSLSFKFAGQDSITAIRSYTHRLDTSPRWTRLAHAGFEGGNYTGCPVAVDGICGPNPKNGCGNPTIGAYVGKAVQILRYPGPLSNQMDLKYYDRATDSWPVFPGSGNIGPSARHSVLEWNVYFQGVDRHRFTGLGYEIDERAPRKYVFSNSLSYLMPDGGGPVLPPYQGEDGEVAFFTTFTDAYLLTQEGSPTMIRMDATGKQTIMAPLPESPGLLATFSIRNIGYVVNQREGQPVRLWAYDPATDTWSRKADFPGASRQRGAAFAMARKGYFGFGLTPDGAGLRDVWQYDPATDRWQSIGEYPGQGHQFLAVFSAPDGVQPERAYVGWGYEAQRTANGFNRVVGCTDWWELTP